MRDYQYRQRRDRGLCRITKDDITLAMTTLFLQAVEREGRYCHRDRGTAWSSTLHSLCREETLKQTLHTYRKGETI